MPTVTKPAVVLAGRPAAERAADARAGGGEALFLVGLAIHCDRLVNLDGEHAQHYDLSRMREAGATATALPPRNGAGFANG